MRTLILVVGLLLAITAGAFLWSRTRSPDGGVPVATTGPPLGPELEGRVDEVLARFDG